MEEYEDIINLPHWNPQRHPRMPRENRAAQFAPFAAVTGLDDAAADTALQHIAMVDPEADDEWIWV